MASVAPKRRVAVLYDGKALHPWQVEAIQIIPPDYEIYYLVCDDHGGQKRNFRAHFAYYLLNIFSVKRAAGGLVSWPAPEDSLQVFKCSPTYQGMWASLPDEAIAWLRKSKVDAVLKFGLSLLRISEALPPILSYHHGNPAKYRGRPAGYYEVRAGEPFCGQIVQQLSNELDAGRVLAASETKVHRHSWKKTLAEAYSLSPFLLPQALKALDEGREIAIDKNGKNFRLPSNADVIKFVLVMMRHAVARLFYGAFFEKRWSVSRILDYPFERLVEGYLPAKDDLEKGLIPTPRKFTFLADPFFYSSEELLVEALDRKNGKGTILSISADETETILLADRKVHFSYPGCIEHDGVNYIVPETASSGCTTIFEYTPDGLKPVRRLDVDANGLLDPTIFKQKDGIYLFANRNEEGPSILRLWFATDLFGKFIEHPLSPIRTSARGARMGGAIISDGKKVFRFGQDFQTSYGDGLIAYEILTLSQTSYSERQVSEIRFEHCKGPHTIASCGNAYAFDYYKESFSILAGFRRLMSKL